MLYNLEVVEIDLELSRGTGLSSDHGGVAPPLLSREGENLVGGTTTPRAVHQPLCLVPSFPMASSK
jgi:hypothetical protein